MTNTTPEAIASPSGNETAGLKLAVYYRIHVPYRTYCFDNSVVYVFVVNRANRQAVGVVLLNIIFESTPLRLRRSSVECDVSSS